MVKKSENLKAMKKEELEKKVADTREAIRVIRFKGQGGKSKNVKETGTLKKQIARALTELKAQAK